MKIIHHLSHTDLDGYGAQWLTSLTLKNIPYKEYNINYYNSDYHEINEYLNIIFSKILNDKNNRHEIFITDINLDENTVEKVNNFVKGNKHININIQLLDHHITGKNSAKKYEWYYLDDSQSATSITYHYYNNKKMFSNSQHIKKTVDCINSYDMWDINNPLMEYGKLFSNFVFNSINYPKGFENNKRKHIFRFLEMITGRLKRNEPLHKIENNFFKDQHIILNHYLQQQQLKKNFDIKKEMTFETKLYFYFYHLIINHKDFNKNYKDIYFKDKLIKVFFDMNQNLFQEFSSHLLNNSKIDICVLVKPNGKMSFRSIGKTNVSEIAKEFFQGGGHKNASGGNISLKQFDKKELTQKLVEKIFQEKINNTHHIYLN